MMRHHKDASMITSNYRQAFDRIRAEYLEMPGMRLTVQQVHRLSGVDVAVCTTVLNDLVRARFLTVSAEGTYVRSAADGPARIPVHRAVRGFATGLPLE
jgi:hypothetical protein